MQCVILAAHGSRNPEANASLVALAASVAAQLAPSNVRHAYLEMAEPSIPQAIAAAVAAGATDIVLLPYFLHPGMHVRRDLVEIVDEARAAHPAVAFTMADFFGNRPEMPTLLAAAARDAIALR
jgi:sirohydrochlorin ferrochelatase